MALQLSLPLDNPAAEAHYGSGEAPFPSGLYAALVSMRQIRMFCPTQHSQEPPECDPTFSNSSSRPAIRSSRWRRPTSRGPCRMVREVARQMGLPLSEWSVTDGLLAVPPAASKPLVEPGKVVGRAAVRQGIHLSGDLSVQGPRPALQGPAGRAVAFAISISRPDSRLWTLVLIDAVALAAGGAPADRPLRRRLAGRRGTRGDRPHDLSRGAAPQPSARSNPS